MIPYPDLTPDQHTALLNDTCPDCGSKTWEHGPRAGYSQNFTCAGCGARFNVAKFIRYVDGQRIGFTERVSAPGRSLMRPVEEERTRKKERP